MSRRRRHEKSIRLDHYSNANPYLATSSSIHDHVISAATDVVAGALSGAFARTVTAPIERVKLIMQLQGSAKIMNSATSTMPSSKSYAGGSGLAVFRHIYREEGFLAFWRGNLQNVIRAAGQAALNFVLMEHYKRLALLLLTTPSTGDNQSPPFPPWMVSLLAGGMVGGTVTTVLYPTEFLRTRLAMDFGRSPQDRQYQGMWDVTRQIVQSDGIRGLYNGYSISLLGSVLYRLLYLGGYDALKNEWLVYKTHKQHQRKQLLEAKTNPTSAAELTPSMTWTERFIMAQFVSLSAGTICYPIDSVRRRMMMEAGKPRDEQLYRNSRQCFARIWNQEGLRGFFLGFGPNLFRSIGGALALVAYDGIKAMMLPVSSV